MPRDAVSSTSAREPFLQIIERVKELCTSAGVVLVLTPELRGTRLNGAARWLSPNRVLIQLSLRHKTDDQFWFSFFHEAGHILDGTGRDYLDAADEPETKKAADEQAADRFARDTLIPPNDWAAFVTRGDVSEDAIRSFAQAHEIPVGVVVGRLHHEKVLDPKFLVSLKKPIRWPMPLS